MMVKKKKKKQSRSESSTEKTPKKTLDPNLLSIFHSKLANGKDLKHMIRGISSKPAQGLSSQSRVVRCPKCHKFLQEPVDVTIYKCSGCNSILQAKRWDNDKDLLSSQNRSCLSTEVESAEDSGSKTPVRTTYRKYSSRSSPCFESAHRRRHETSYSPREWMRRADEFSVTGDFASERSCFGVVKLSITKKEDTTLLDLLRFSDSGTRFAEESVVMIKEDIRSKFYDLKLEAFQPSLNHKLREKQPASRSENTGETSRIHLEKSEEESAEEGGGGSKTPVRSSYRKYSSRASPLFETSYSRRKHETTSYISREWMTSASPSPSSYGYTSSPFLGSQVSSSAAASPIHYQGETSSDQKYYHWSSQQSRMLHDSQYDHNLHESSSWSGLLDLSSVTKREEGDVTRRSVSSEFYELNPEAFHPQWNHKSSEASGETSRIHLEKSHSVEPLIKNEHLWETKYTRDMQEFDLGEFKWEDIMGDKGDSICDSSSSSNGEMYEEDTKHISNQIFIENPDQSGKATYMIHEDQSSSRGSLSDHESSEESALAHEEENRIEEVKIGVMVEDGPSLHLGKCGYESTTLEETFGLKEESTPVFCLHEPELGTLLEPDNEEAGDGSSESSSKGSFNSHEPRSITAEAESEAEEEILRDHLQNENESSAPTSENVGLRHALYQTQTSPLWSPLSSPINTPNIGSSPLHIRMHSSVNSHIVSPLRSPTNSPGSLSDVLLFFGKKT